MKKWIMGFILLALIALSACGSPAPTATPQPTLVSARTSGVSGQVVADAQVVPVQWVMLSFQVGGPVAAVNVQEGEAVKAGAVLAQVADTDAKLVVAQAEAALTLAQAQLAQTQAKPQAASIAQAEQGVQEAQAAVLVAQAQLARLQTGVRPADIAAAEAGVAQAAYNLKVAQDNYAWAKDTNKENSAADKAAVAQQAYDAAQKQLAQLKAGPTKAELDAARAGISAAQAQQTQAQSQLDLLQAGATPEQIAVAEAGVRQAQVAVDQAKAGLTNLQITAPFDGIVVSLNTKPGELASAGLPVIWLADLSAWQIETDDLTELSVVNVHQGDNVAITFDAIPDLEMTGKVVRIKSFGESSQGDIVYTVIIQPDKHDARLRWNMTASVTIGAK